ncbi:hypothetical protein C8R43DRAFT_1138627 [Mycena crocata]|nr:hypothetical protein C8R43DRAFT_1138627 [Mycena crocata]
MTVRVLFDYEEREKYQRRRPVRYPRDSEYIAFLVRVQNVTAKLYVRVAPYWYVFAAVQRLTIYRRSLLAHFLPYQLSYLAHRRPKLASPPLHPVYGSSGTHIAGGTDFAADAPHALRQARASTVVYDIFGALSHLCPQSPPTPSTILSPTNGPCLPSSSSPTKRSSTRDAVNASARKVCKSCALLLQNLRSCRWRVESTSRSSPAPSLPSILTRMASGVGTGWERDVAQRMLVSIAVRLESAHRCCPPDVSNLALTRKFGRVFPLHARLVTTPRPSPLARGWAGRMHSVPRCRRTREARHRTSRRVVLRHASHHTAVAAAPEARTRIRVLRIVCGCCPTQVRAARHDIVDMTGLWVSLPGAHYYSYQHQGGWVAPEPYLRMLALWTSAVDIKNMNLESSVPLADTLEVISNGLGTRGHGAPSQYDAEMSSRPMRRVVHLRTRNTSCLSGERSSSAHAERGVTSCDSGVTRDASPSLRPPRHRDTPPLAPKLWLYRPVSAPQKLSATLPNHKQLHTNISDEPLDQKIILALSYLPQLV